VADGHPGDLDVEAYAALAAKIAQAGTKRGEVLEDNGLDEEQWAVIDEQWQARLSAAVDEDEGEGVPDLVVRHSNAYRLAQQRLTQGGADKVMSLESFCKAIRAMQHGGSDPQRALGALGMTLGDFLKANEYWTQRIGREPELHDRYLALLQAFTKEP